MIKASGNVVTGDELINLYPSNKFATTIINQLSSSRKEYDYSSLNELKFEIDLRVSIIETSIQLYRSDMQFKTFRKSFCNEDFWTRLNNGGFLLKDGISPSDAIKDIFLNSSKYGTECATAMVIIYYKAVLNIFAEKLFNELFTNLKLMGWYYIDKDLSMQVYHKLEDYLPGNCRYFKNPDVNPSTPQWQGENVIDLGEDTYYGHGIGIGSADKIIEVLNRRRKEEAKDSAYLTDWANHPNFKALANNYYDSAANTRYNFSKIV